MPRHKEPTIYARLADSRQERVEYHANGKPKPVTGATNYFVRFQDSVTGKRTSLTVATLEEAIVKRQQIVLLTDFRANSTVTVAAPKHERKTIAEAVAEFLAKTEKDVKNGGKSPETLVAYRKAIEDFRDHSSAVYMDTLPDGGLTEKIIIGHFDWLRENLVRRNGGHFQNTLAKRFRFLNVFFAASGIKLAKDANPKTDDRGLIKRGDVPQVREVLADEKEAGVHTYSTEDLDAMLKVADVDEADLIHFALKTGFRDSEIAHAEWADIDWTGRKRNAGTANILVSVKAPSASLPQGFRPKNGRSRKVPIPTLVERLKARQERLGTDGSTLIFPNGKGQPNNHLIDILKQVVSKAEKNGYKVEGEIGWHRFRRTFGTLMYQSTHDLPTVALLLGHVKKNGQPNIEVTNLYLATDQSKAAMASEAAFAGIGLPD